MSNDIRIDNVNVETCMNVIEDFSDEHYISVRPLDINNLRFNTILGHIKNCQDKKVGRFFDLFRTETWKYIWAYGVGYEYRYFRQDLWSIIFQTLVDRALRSANDAFIVTQGTMFVNKLPAHNSRAKLCRPYWKALLRLKHEQTEYRKRLPDVFISSGIVFNIKVIHQLIFSYLPLFVNT